MGIYICLMLLILFSAYQCWQCMLRFTAIYWMDILQDTTVSFLMYVDISTMIWIQMPKDRYVTHWSVHSTNHPQQVKNLSSAFMLPCSFPLSLSLNTCTHTCWFKKSQMKVSILKSFIIMLLRSEFTWCCDGFHRNNFEYLGYIKLNSSFNTNKMGHLLKDYIVDNDACIT